MINVNSILENNPTLTAATARSGNVNSAFSGLVNGAKQNSMDDIFKAASEKYSISESLLKAVAQTESNFQTDAVSSCGAQGVMQLMPDTANYLGVNDPFDAEQNIMGGAKYLSGLLNQYDGDVKLALAAYNAGSGNVDKYGGVPPFEETQNYVVKVMGLAGENLTVPNSATIAAQNPTATSQTQKTTTGKVYNTGATSESSKMLQDILGFTGFSKDDYSMFIKLFLAAIMMPKAEDSTNSGAQGIANQWLSDLNKTRVVQAETPTSGQSQGQDRRTLSRTL